MTSGRPGRRGDALPSPRTDRAARSSVRQHGSRVVAMLAGLVGLALLLPASALAHSLNPSYASRLPLAVYVAGAAMTVALSFVVVLARDLKATAPDLTGPADVPRRITRYTLRSAGAHRLGLDRRPGHRRRVFRRRRRDAVPVGLRLGRRGDGIGLHRPGLAVPRSVLDPARHRRLRSSTGSASERGNRPTTRPGSGAGPASSGSRPSSGSSSP